MTDELIAPVALTEAVLTRTEPALAPTATVNVMTGADDNGAMAVDVVAVTVCPTTENNQPVPVSLKAVKPTGKVSTTVIRPLVAAGPTLETVIV